MKENKPTITCEWSESNYFEDGKTYSVAEFNSLMKKADDEWLTKRQEEIDKYGDDFNAIYDAYERGEIDEVHQGYAKTKFTINMPDGTKYSERQDIGDGDGSVIDFLKRIDIYKSVVTELEKYIDHPDYDPKLHNLMNDLKKECDNYLKTGEEKCLQTGTVEKQIEKMNELYKKMPENDYLTKRQIYDYAKEMRAVKINEEKSAGLPFKIGDDIEYKGHKWHISNIDKQNDEIEFSRETGNIVVPIELRHAPLSEAVKFVEKGQKDMKDTFEYDTSLNLIKDMIKKKEPYTVLAVSTTGLDNKDFDGHMPTKICLAEYTFDDKVKQYRQNGILFNKMVDCGQQAFDKAIENKEQYDVFAHGGIDIEDYKKNKMSVDEFKKELDSVVKASKDGQLIVNNADFCKKYLDKIGCGQFIDEKDKENKLIDQMNLTKEILSKRGINKGYTLEKLNTELFGKEEEIIGAENRTKVMSKAITQCGREMGYLESERQEAQREEEQGYIESLSEQGKQSYQKSTNEDKQNTWKEMGIVNADNVLDRNGDCDLNKLYDVLSKKDGNKGITVMQVATTGFKANNEPIRFVAVAFNIENGKLVPTKRGTDVILQASSRAIQLAKQDSNFNAFEYAGLDFKEYEKRAIPVEKAVEKISAFFKVFDEKEYPIVTNGKDKNSLLSFTGSAMSKVCNIPEFSSTKFIDFSSVIKEFTCLKSDSEQPNPIIPNDIKSFKLEDIAKANEMDISSTRKRCSATVQLVEKIAEDDHYKEIKQDYKEIGQAEQEIEVADEGNILDDETISKVVNDSTPLEMPKGSEETAERSDERIKIPYGRRVSDAENQRSRTRNNYEMTIEGKSEQIEALKEMVSSLVTVTSKQMEIITEQSRMISEQLKAKDEQIAKLTDALVEKSRPKQYEKE